MGGALIDPGTSVGVWDKSAGDCGLNSLVMHLMGFTRFNRHKSTSSSKLLECQCALLQRLHDTDPLVKSRSRHAVARGNVLYLRGRISQKCPDFPDLLVV